MNGTPSAGVTRGGLVHPTAGGTSGVINAVDSKNGVFVNVYGYLVKNR